MSGISGIGSGYSDLYSKIASGNRIQRAKDDPAGQAIASKMEAQQRTQAMQQRNAAMQQDAINVADGARANMSAYVQDINELSVQAMNGLYSDSDRQAIQNQINQYKMGISEAANQARYNETNVAGDGVSALRSTGLENFDVTSGSANLDAVSGALDSISSARSADGATANGLEASISNLANARENTMAGLSRIADMDIAEGASELKKQQTLDQASVSMQKQQMENEANFMSRMFGA